MEPFLGQIQTFGFNFAPIGWAFCDGQLLPISSYNALFSLLGTTYGGDGRTTFGLPDLRGRVTIHPGNGPGLPSYSWGQKSGSATVTLTTAEMPNHSHTLLATDEDGDVDTPNGHIIAKTGEDAFSASSVSVTMGNSIGNTGGNQPINIMQPYLAMYTCIALQGIYPSRS